MLSVYLEHGIWDKVILSYRQMLEERWSPNVFIYSTVLEACGSLGEQESLFSESQLKNETFLEVGRALHADIRGIGFATGSTIASALITMYGKCGSISEALSLFKGFSEFDIVPWRAMLSAYVQQDQGAEALVAYKKLHEYGLVPDVHIFVISLRACILLMENEEVTPLALLEIGEALSKDAQSNGFASNTVVGNTLVSIYGMSGNIMGTENVFVGLIQRDVVSWNAMMSVYIQHGQVVKALLLYRQMVVEGVTANVLSYVLCFQACSILAENENLLRKRHDEPNSTSIQVGHAFHAVIRRLGHCSSTFICNALISMYGKCGLLVEAENVFYSFVVMDVVSWNAMLTTYVENGKGHKALHLFCRMLRGGDIQTS
ncbi:hypothetical protein L7F22_023431 [Adiantum nelumboides]|nr:hypothetical protein [Adiantum nelumboides]